MTHPPGPAVGDIFIPTIKLARFGSVILLTLLPIPEETAGRAVCTETYCVTGLPDAAHDPNTPLF